MAVNYKCNRCGNFESNLYGDMKKHLTRKNCCIKNGKYAFLSDDQMLCLSILPYHNNKHILEENEIDNLKNSNIIHKNKNELFNELKIIETNKLKCCKFCNEEFPFIIDLKKHVITTCFKNKLQNKDAKSLCTKINSFESVLNAPINSLYNQNDINTINNNTTNNNNNNNTNIYFDIKQQTLVPFDKEWDISKISIGDKSRFMISQFMYTELLEEILKNELNLNVIIDKDNDSGMVYKNDIDKYIQMKVKDIVSNTMDKLNIHLNDINKSEKNALKEIKTFSRQIINKKHNDYKNSETIQEGVIKCMTNIYETKKEEASNMAKNIVRNIEEYRI